MFLPSLRRWHAMLLLKSDKFCKVDALKRAHNRKWHSGQCFSTIYVQRCRVCIQGKYQHVVVHAPPSFTMTSITHCSLGATSVGVGALISRYVCGWMASSSSPSLGKYVNKCMAKKTHHGVPRITIHVILRTSYFSTSPAVYVIYWQTCFI